MKLLCLTGGCCWDWKKVQYKEKGAPREQVKSEKWKWYVNSLEGERGPLQIIDPTKMIAGTQ